MPLTLVRADEPGAGLDRGAAAAASLVSTASLDALARATGTEGAVDGRRFRMTFGVAGVEAHAEDGMAGPSRIGGRGGGRSARERRPLPRDDARPGHGRA